LHQIIDARQFLCAFFRHGSSFHLLLHCATAISPPPHGLRARRAIHGHTVPTLQIIGSPAHKWNVFSIFI
jgi:hypothetical protein